MDDILYCPLCGKELSPSFGFDNDRRRRLVADCDEHGELDIEVLEVVRATAVNGAFGEPTEGDDG